MPAMAAMRFNPDLKRVYDRLNAKGKHAKIVTIRRETRVCSGGDGIVVVVGSFPVPGQEFMEA
ncbi:hypothetical protein CFR79_15040, partial [Komagataeibacter saccharivorans]|uniref:hypothetical protein n=1 Tax=Komagataeibacter saccharivorans TaxID=265959 RepID=UPI000D94D1FE